MFCSNKTILLFIITFWKHNRWMRKYNSRKFDFHDTYVKFYKSAVLKLARTLENFIIKCKKGEYISGSSFNFLVINLYENNWIFSSHLKQFIPRLKLITKLLRVEKLLSVCEFLAKSPTKNIFEVLGRFSSPDWTQKFFSSPITFPHIYHEGLLQRTILKSL